MAVRVFFVSILIAVLMVRAANAEGGSPSSTPGTSIVTILSDGLSDPGSPIVKALGELTIAIDKKAPGLRVLTVMGYGGATNAHDLLQLRGADLAVLNNDIFAALDREGEGEEARRKIKLIMPLNQQAVFLFVSPKVKTLENLAGGTVAVPAGLQSRASTAKTVFSLLKIPVSIREISAKEVSPPDAILLFESDLAQIASLGSWIEPYKLLPFPASGPLSKVYRSKIVAKEALGDYSGSEDLKTIEVITVLASFDWTDKQARYRDVVRFIEEAFLAIPSLRSAGPASLWASTDIRAAVPGWQRMVSVERRTVGLAPALPNDNVKLSSLLTKPKPQPLGPVEVVAPSRPPLSGAAIKDGGIIVQILRDALGASGRDSVVVWDDGKASDVIANDAASPNLSIYVETPDCKGASSNPPPLCASIDFSEPVLQLVIGLFAKEGSPLLDAGKGDAPAKICTSFRYPSRLDAQGPLMDWIRKQNPLFLSRPGLIDCVAAVEAGDADAFLATEAEARFVMTKLLPAGTMAMSTSRTAIAAVRAGSPKLGPSSKSLLTAVNDAIAQSKKNGRYAAALAAHMGDLTGAPLQAAP